jgi:hypothetical protein
MRIARHRARSSMRRGIRRFWPNSETIRRRASARPTQERWLENYTFLTSEMAVARPNVYAGRKRQSFGGVSNVHQNQPPSPHWSPEDASHPMATQGNHIWASLSEYLSIPKHSNSSLQNAESADNGRLPQSRRSGHIAPRTTSDPIEVTV